MKHILRILVLWLPLGVAVTLISGIIYATVQQNYRQSLNDPQIQMAEDAANAIEQGSSATSVVPEQQINIAESLAPWIAVYDASDTPIASSGLLGGQMPQPPQGEFLLARQQGNNLPHNTWQPQPGVRQAIVIVPVQNGGFVVAGRNMSEVEMREENLEVEVGIGWIITIIATLLAQALVEHAKKCGVV